MIAWLVRIFAFLDLLPQRKIKTMRTQLFTYSFTVFHKSVYRSFTATVEGRKRWSKKRKGNEIMCTVQHTSQLLHSPAPHHCPSVAIHESPTGLILLPQCSKQGRRFGLWPKGAIHGVAEWSECQVIHWGAVDWSFSFYALWMELDILGATYISSPRIPLNIVSYAS